MAHNLSFGATATHDSDQPLYLQEQTLKKELAAVRFEIVEHDAEVRKLQELRAIRVKDEQNLVEQLHYLQSKRRVHVNNSNERAKASDEIDYNADWEWSKQMQAKM